MAGTAGWVGRTYIALSFSVGVGNALVYLNNCNDQYD